MLCRMLRDTGVAEMFEYSSLRLHIISFHFITHIHNFCENCRSRLYIKSQKYLLHTMLSYDNSI